MTSAKHPIDNTSNLRRYLLATVLPIVFLLLSLSVLVYDQVQLFSFTRSEIEGVKMINLLYDALTDLQKIRGYSQISLSGEHREVTNQLEQLKTQFLDRFHDQDWLQETAAFHLQAESDHLEAESRRLFHLQSDPAASDAPLFSLYSSLITEILQLMQLTADHSNLILDPELDTYYLIDVLDRQIPYLVESIGRVRGMGSGLLAKKEIHGEEKDKLHDFHAAIEARIESIQNAQEIILKTSSDLKESFNLLPDNLNSVMNPFINACKCIEEGKDCPGMQPETFFNLGTQTIDLLTTPYHTGILLLTSKLKDRQSRHLWQGGLIFFGTVIAILLMLYFNRAFYLDDQELHREMEQLSITDQLTELHNRRYFYTVFPRELRNSLRHKKQLYLGLLDVDNFKRYNDTYGHPEGDRVLKKIASIITSLLQRAGDYSFRIGGEEFCFLFCEADPENARNFADRIRLAVEEARIEHRGNPPHGIVTVSIGLVKIPEDPDCVLEQVMSTVDKALYEAKEKGRNRCIFYG